MKTLSNNDRATERIRAGERMTVTGAALVEVDGVGKYSVSTSQTFGPYTDDVLVTVSAFGTVTVNVTESADEVLPPPARFSTDANGNTVLVGADGKLEIAGRAYVPDYLSKSVPIVLDDGNQASGAYSDFATDGTGSLTAQANGYGFLQAAGVHINAPDGTYARVGNKFTTAKSVGSGAIGIFLKWDDDLGIGGTLYLSNDVGWTNAASIAISGNVAVPKGWRLHIIPQSSFTIGGTFAWATGIKQWRFAAYINASYPHLGFGGLVADVKTTPLITFSCDDGWASQRSVAAPILGKYGYSATSYITTGQIGNAPNYCTSAELLELQNLYGWAIANHGRSHLNYSTLTSSQMAADFNNGVSDLIAIGANAPYHFAYPYGASQTSTADASDPATVLAALGMVTGRIAAQVPYGGFSAYGFGVTPGIVNPHRMKAQQVGGSTNSLAALKAAVLTAVTNQENINLYFHDILTTNNPAGLGGANPVDGNQFYKDDFESLVAYVKELEMAGSAVVEGNINNWYAVMNGAGRATL